MATRMQTIDVPSVSAVAHQASHAVSSPHRSALVHILRPHINLAIWRRAVPEPIAGWLSRCSATEVAKRSRDIDICVPAACVPASLGAAIAARAIGHQADISPLVRDAADLAGLVARISRNPRVRLRLEWVTDQPCSNFHVDRVPFRLVCTYRGPGTEWVSNATAERLTSPESLPPAGEIYRLASGDVAVMRGWSKGDHSTIPLKHRSPPVGFPAVWRLFLAIDPAPASGQA